MSLQRLQVLRWQQARSPHCATAVSRYIAGSGGSWRGRGCRLFSGRTGATRLRLGLTHRSMMARARADLAGASNAWRRLFSRARGRIGRGPRSGTEMHLAPVAWPIPAASFRRLPARPGRPTMPMTAHSLLGPGSTRPLDSAIRKPPAGVGPHVRMRFRGSAARDAWATRRTPPLMHPETTRGRPTPGTRLGGRQGLTRRDH